MNRKSKGKKGRKGERKDDGKQPLIHNCPCCTSHHLSSYIKMLCTTGRSVKELKYKNRLSFSCLENQGIISVLYDTGFSYEQ